MQSDGIRLDEKPAFPLYIGPHLLIAMQKVVGSSPISRFRSSCKSLIFETAAVRSYVPKLDTERTLGANKSAGFRSAPPTTCLLSGLSRSFERATF
jgi:hypothetical protein